MQFWSPGFGQSGLALGFVAAYGMNQLMEELYLSLPFFHSAFEMNK